MELFHISLFNDKPPEIQKGWNFFKGSLEIRNLDGSTSLFGEIKNSFGKELITLYNGFLNYDYPHHLRNDMRQNETYEWFLLTLVSDGFIDTSKTFRKKEGCIKIGPKRKKDKSLVLLTLCLKKDQKFIFKVENRHDGKIREFTIGFSCHLDNLFVEDTTPIIVKPTLTLRALRFLVRLLYKKTSVFVRF